MTESALTYSTAGSLALDRNPAAAYLAGLESKSSRRTMRAALAQIAGLMGRADLNGARLSEAAGADLTNVLQPGATMPDGTKHD